MATRRTIVPEGKQRVRVATGIYLKANGKYLAQYRDPGHKQHWQEFLTKAAAERWRAQALLDPRTVLAGRRTLAEVWDSMLQHHSQRLRPTTLANWQQEWRKYIEPALGSWPIGRITIPVVKSFLADRGRSASRVRSGCGGACEHHGGVRDHELEAQGVIRRRREGSRRLQSRGLRGPESEPGCTRALRASPGFLGQMCSESRVRGRTCRSALLSAARMAVQDESRASSGRCGHRSTRR